MSTSGFLLLGFFVDAVAMTSMLQMSTGLALLIYEIVLLWSDREKANTRSPRIAAAFHTRIFITL